MLTTNQKGAIAEAAIIHEATKVGIPVLRPTTDERYDIVLDLRGRFVRVQCKWAALQGEVVVFRCRSCRRAREGLRHKSYSSDEIDAFAAYCADLDRSFYTDGCCANASGNPAPHFTGAEQPAPWRELG